MYILSTVINIYYVNNAYIEKFTNTIFTKLCFLCKIPDQEKENQALQIKIYFGLTQNMLFVIKLLD